jgi:hypothetical protein
MKKLITTLALISYMWGDMGFGFGSTRGVLSSSGFVDALLNDHHNYPLNTTSKQLSFSGINTDNTAAKGLEFGFYSDWFNWIFTAEGNQSDFFNSNQLYWMDFEAVLPIIRSRFLSFEITPNIGFGAFSRSFGVLGTSEVLVLSEGTFYPEDTLNVSAMGVSYGVNATLKMRLNPLISLYAKYGYRVSSFTKPQLTITKPSKESYTYNKDGSVTTETVDSTSTTITDNNAFDTSSSAYESNIDPFGSASINTSGHLVSMGIIIDLDMRKGRDR